MKKVCVHLASGFEEIEAISIIDVLRRAGISVIIVSVTGKLEVEGAHQVTVIADKLFEDVNYQDIDMLILPGGMPGSKNLDEHEGLKQQIVDFHTNNKPIGAICAAPMVLGHLGILENIEATCYPGFEVHLHGAIVTGEPVIQFNNIVTGKGAGVAIQFALKIVEMLVSKKTAERLAKKMIVGQNNRPL
ncbi:DJ-1/YajL/PfpI superfamily, includes chaperone protein YajL (former ThiJ), parkinsonism-associated protein DJ-1, peptidases PfpI, Hsp31 [hydrothermal vent metagenome]|uniref:DJ-1/YajL/PfpI superfamily, includes chaperone protein YajL (Former ThiJ), parkinsonism-associated protein DJ-1, peptidases PfpI, Hsp31 n=1 Tax=hydrothermal vent metagenome TaxID=652676 RepID=A0A3B0UHL2_9ZZZZ